MTNRQEDLIAGCIREDRKSMEAFYKTYFPVLYPVAARFSRDQLEAREILNTAMLKIFKGLAGFRAECALFPWMKTIVINTGLDLIRSRNKTAVHTELSHAAEVWIEASQDHQFTHEEMLHHLRKLPEMGRAVLTLFAIEGYSHQEIAEKLCITEVNSRWHLHQARMQLRQSIAQQRVAV